MNFTSRKDPHFPKSPRVEFETIFKISILWFSRISCRLPGANFFHVARKSDTSYLSEICGFPFLTFCKVFCLPKNDRVSNALWVFKHVKWLILLNDRSVPRKQLYITCSCLPTQVMLTTFSDSSNIFNFGVISRMHQTAWRFSVALHITHWVRYNEVIHTYHVNYNNPNDP